MIGTENDIRSSGGIGRRSQVPSVTVIRRARRRKQRQLHVRCKSSPAAPNYYNRRIVKWLKKIVNAKITDVTISMADHDCLTFDIRLDGGSWGVSVGGYCIGKGYLGAKEFSAENGGGLVAMMRIMDTVGVERWEDLKGKYCRVKDNGWGSTITTIGNIIEDKWFDLGEFFRTYNEK